LVTSGVILFVLFLTGAAGHAALASNTLYQTGQASPIHPEYPLLDGQGQNVLDSGEAISTMQTCGACHDTDFIASHSYHADLGYRTVVSPDLKSSSAISGAHPFDYGQGFFGRWDPLYLPLSPSRYKDLDLLDWVVKNAPYHVGGGPAAVLGDDTQAGTMGANSIEMNCFLCHTPEPDNEARIAAIRSGDFQWSGAATLIKRGIVSASNGNYSYNPTAFTPEGNLAREIIAIQDPTNENCGQCHGLVHIDLEQPLTLPELTLGDPWLATGQVISPQRLSDSGVNLANKADLTRVWDVHAERQVQCTDCHFSLNNPVYFQEGEETRPGHLLFDPRRLEFGEFLLRPIHDFAGGTFGDPAGVMRSCDGCHNISTSHTWLPYQERHMESLACQACHIPEIYSPAYQSIDWTVVTKMGEPKVEYRGVEFDSFYATPLVAGYTPVLLLERDAGSSRLAPFNLVSAWYWVSGDPPQPVPLETVQAAWLDEASYHPDVMAWLDADRNGSLDANELTLDTPEKVEVITLRLAELGLESPRITGEVRSYPLNHGVVAGKWATQECSACHTSESLTSAPILLAGYLPGGVLPEITGIVDTSEGEVSVDSRGALYFRPLPSEAGLYIFGHNRAGWVDVLGGMIFLGVLAGIAGHGSLRLFTALRRPHHSPKVRKVYMYAVYERFWHWLQTVVILGLIFTGLVIHRPDLFALFSFKGMVLVHNILAAILVINAALSLFYHLVSGQIRQYIPRPAGFFDQAISQAVYYLRGIFKGERHPFEKRQDKKLNPLQQVTYIGILNVLLPLQIISGALIWGAQRWPFLASQAGGLPFLGPFHTLIAWLFASFVVMHVYLTTTGHAPMSAIQAMVVGWDEVEVHDPGQEKENGRAQEPESKNGHGINHEPDSDEILEEHAL
jgi:thiosulfate reductase cytochrome b subunit